MSWKLARRVLYGLIGLTLLLVAGLLIWLQSRYEAYPETTATEVATPVDELLDSGTTNLITDQLEAYRAEMALPSISAAVGINDRIAYAAATGYADLDRRIAATPESLYRIGSVSKSITAVALGRLLDDERIALDAPFHYYLPDFPGKRWPFTIRQLASHTAGVRHYRQDLLDNLEENYHDVHYESVRDSLVLVESDPLLFEPGTRYQYSSYGFNMLSAAMVAAVETSFKEQLQHFVFNPADMPTAMVEDAPNPNPVSVGYYILSRDRLYRSPYADNSYKVAGGGIIATSSDLVAFGNALLSGRLVSAAVMEELFTPTVLQDGSSAPQNYGLGFRVNTREIGGQSYVEVGHGGSSIGGLTAFLMYPEVGLVIAVTTNVATFGSDATPYASAYAIADLLLPTMTRL